MLLGQGRSAVAGALVEAEAQFARALDQIATLPATPALRREQINSQVAIITPLLHVKGYAAPEAKAAVERARLLIEQAAAIGEPPQDPLLLFSVLYGSWVANYAAFSGAMMRELAAQFLALAQRGTAIVPVMVGHRLAGISFLCTGDFAQARMHFDRALTLYNPTEHRALATRFGADVRVATLFYRSWALWVLGYPHSGLADSERALHDAREIGQAATLMNTLTITGLRHIFCGDYAGAGRLTDELVGLSDEKGAAFWKTVGLLLRGCLFTLTGRSAEAVQIIAAGLAAFRSTGATLFVPGFLSYLAKAYADTGQFESASRCIGEAMKAIGTTGESWFEAEAHRIAGEIELMQGEPDAAQAEVCFERALAIARAQQAKSWELRAATSLARLWQNQHKCDEACALLAPVHHWFTEGFESLDLKEAKSLLNSLGA